MRMSDRRTLVVIPTYNESENIRPLATAVLALPGGMEILVVDDSSPDGTGDIARDLSRETSGRVHLLERPGKAGLGTAYLAGFRWGLEQGYDAIVQMDADFSHDPERVPVMVAGLDRADLVIGSRYVEGGGTVNWGLMRKVVSRGGSLYARLLLALPVSDVTGGFKAWRGDTLARLGLDKVRSNGYCFQVEMTWRAFNTGARIREVPIVFIDRRVGLSKMSGSIFLEAVWRVPLLALGVTS
jgi:dolichol-phosphate mannosyltransferase